MAITRAYRTDHWIGRKFRAHSRIIEMRQSTHGPLVVRVLFVGTGRYAGHATSAHSAAAPPRGSGGWGKVFSAFYFKPTGEWKLDLHATRRLIRSIGIGPPAFNVRYHGSGTETSNASSPGEVVDNPDCDVPAAVQKAQSRFEFDGAWTVNMNGMLESGVGDLRGTGSDEVKQQDGCIGIHGPVAPHTKTCSITSKDTWPSSNFYAQLSAAVDRRADHELRLRLPSVVNDPVLCGAPEVWETDADGPVAYGHSILVPDARATADSPFAIKLAVNESLPPVGCLIGYPEVTCTNRMAWTGRVVFTPLKIPSVTDLHFTTPDPPPSWPLADNGTRG